MLARVHICLAPGCVVSWSTLETGVPEVHFGKCWVTPVAPLQSAPLPGLWLEGAQLSQPSPGGNLLLQPWMEANNSTPKLIADELVPFLKLVSLASKMGEFFLIFFLGSIKLHN